MDKDKLKELKRYDSRAQVLLAAGGGTRPAEACGSSAMPRYLRAPYICYEKYINDWIDPGDEILELGAGSGLHTWALVKIGSGSVTATDISSNALRLLRQRMAATGVGARLRTCAADMEALPFTNDCFDVVACAGSLSYGEPALVDTEIRRVLRPGGLLICVDSLNHNPIYRLNRWGRYRRGERSQSTLRRMPTLARIAAMSSGFAISSVRYFGAFSFTMPAVASLIGDGRAQAVSDCLDRLIRVKRSAFKFVLFAKGLRK